jgi:PAS domain S-box-containing protein
MSEADEVHKLKLEIEQLQTRLQELEETMASVCGGTADAIIVSTVDGDKIFTLKTAEQPYRLFVEQMLQGAVLLSEDGTILYCNNSFAELVKEKPEVVVGSKIQQYVSPDCIDDFNCLLMRNRQEKSRIQSDLNLQTKDASTVQVQVSLGQIQIDNIKAVCLVFVKLP